ncbi:FtsK/SpoIIIE family DNA translocase [Clostridium chauvoei]|uniref:DNA translocase FtsK n=2 Tax=Clostridium chauvoei TaxID=46867 RepID=A0ABD4RK67_9CLOT|nr:DNA translocase FtsK [Clostridium chauvoei]ATD54983.1 cell division protein FtsK [Clostridium chauvoei]ATD57340.1 cell division protein FtsK [Clostridium chauvoei]MBX7281516.1 DNA translocase FtsK [Clostridium chauvoei]MBX7284037.1 DNA translocase FtsK [Clostridium chauvoei]MBX7286564.1 DNA translocase FtsK [Clostridium chauvoei]
MARGKGNNTKAAKGKQTSKNKENGDIKGIIYISTGILLAIAIYTTWAGALSIFSRKVIYNLLGVGAFILPAYLVYFGIDSILSKGTIQFSRRFFGVTMVAFIIILGCSTGNLNVMNSREGFSETLKNVILQGGLHGGLIGYMIAYPLSQLLGYLGSYVLYITLGFIGIILVFDITLYDVIMYFKDEHSKAKLNKKSRKIENKVSDETTIQTKNDLVNVVPKVQDKEREEFINGINNKIKILDFMKSSSLEDVPTIEDISSREIATDKSIKNPFDIKVFDDDNKALKEDTKPIERHVKKGKLDDESKEVMTKEIEDNISSETKIEEKIYHYPTVDLLNINSKMRLKSEDKKELIENANKLEGILNDFGVDAKVVQVTKGPSVTRFEIQPSPGVKVSKIVNLQDDIALGLAASGVRMEAPIPGKAAIGIEVPNRKQTPVFLREVLDSKEFKNSNNRLAFALGKDIAGKCVVGDLSKMPHMLIAGATGSGKSVCINALIISLLYKYSPEEVKLLMIDPKVVELSVYNGIPHLLIPVVTDPKKAAAALNWAVNEMTRRYKLFADSSVRNVESYNALFEKGMIEEKLPYIVMIVDELADLMMACPNDVEDYICRLAQMARAAGMHLIIATQRPSVDVITGVIKANIPSRISFAVSSGVDSRTILDSTGAEKLLGRGDMLYYPIGESKPLRVQGAFIDEDEVEKVVSFVKDREEETIYKEEIIEHIENGVSNSNSHSNDSEGDTDELLNEAINIVVEYSQASTSFLQRKLRIGFNRASRIMDELEERGIISSKDGSKPRQVLISKEELGLED